MPGRYNEILAGRYNRGLQKLFQMKGGPPVPQLGSDISATIDVDTMLALENRILMSVRSFSRSATIPAGGAGNRSAYRLRNPSNSNVVAIIEKVSFWGTLADQPFLTRGPQPTTDYGTSDAGNNSIRDVRMGPINSVLVASSKNNDGTIAGFAELEVAFGANGSADGILYENQEIVVGPNDQVSIFSNVLNQALNFTLMWRERAIEESELQTLL